MGQGYLPLAGAARPAEATHLFGSAPLTNSPRPRFLEKSTRDGR